MADPSYIVDGVLTDSEAWVGLGTTTLGSDTAVVTFTSTDNGQVGDFSQYMDLVIISYGRTNGAGSSARELNMQLNNDTAANYYAQRIHGTGAAVYAGATSGAVRFEIGNNAANDADANIFGVTVTTLFDINSGKYKSGLSQSACDLDGSGAVYLWALTWQSQAPITEIDLYDLYGSDLLTASSFSLFGVLPRMVA